jgi:hypothetical protein
MYSSAALAVLGLFVYAFSPLLTLPLILVGVCLICRLTYN